MSEAEGRSAAPTEDPEIEGRARARRLAAGYRAAARRAVAFARAYRREEGAGGARERACLAQARAWRQAARDVAAGGAARPGLARALPAARGDAGRRTG